MKIYVAAPFEHGPRVRELHDKLRELGHEPTARWVEVATGDKDCLHLTSIERIKRSYAENDEDVAASDLLVALVAPGLGKEMFCEAALARQLGKPIYWVGQEQWMPLSAYRPMSARSQDVPSLLCLLEELSRPKDGLDSLERVRRSMRVD